MAKSQKPKPPQPPKPSRPRRRTRSPRKPNNSFESSVPAPLPGGSVDNAAEIAAILRLMRFLQDRLDRLVGGRAGGA